MNNVNPLPAALAMASPLSPTTAAATSGMTLKYPALRREPIADSNRPQLGATERPVDRVKQQHPLSARVDMGDKENSEPQRDSLDSNCSDDMEIDDSTDSSESRDSLALSSSSSESCASQQTDTCIASQLERYDEERGEFSSQVDAGPAKQLRYNTTETNSNGRSNEELDGEDIEDEDDAGSECSGGTVVANDFPEPPQDATEEEMNRYYWEVCYGEQAQSMMEERQQSAAKGLRSAPSKSCLSTKKLKNTAASTSMTPRRLHPSPPGTIEVTDETALSTPNDDESPSTSAANTAKKSQSAVKFGTNSAAEFDKLQPITEMTPMPSHVVQEIFPSESKEEAAEEQEVSRETKQNVAMLAEWDELFDDELEQTPKRKRGRKRTPYKSKNRRPSKSRRDSTVFSKEGINKERMSLLEDSDDEHMLPLSVTIDPLQYTSPSTIAASERDSLESETVETTETQVNRDSLGSACISPNSLVSSQTLGRETPKSARTSSSTILRAVHASGAELPSNSPQGGQGNGLRPNQLNYSPGNSTGLSSDSSPTCSDNQSLGSDIMSLFTQHTIDTDSSDTDSFQQHLSVLSNNPLQMLHLRIGDMVHLMKALKKDPLQFLNENILHSLTPATALTLITGYEETNSLLSQLLQSISPEDNVRKVRSIGCLESILQNEIIIACGNQNILRSIEKSEATAATDGEETITSCVQASHDTAMHEWSKIELAIARHVLTKLKELTEKVEEDKNANNEDSAPAAAVDPNKIQEEAAKIKALEEELATETTRLTELKRAQQILRSSLDIECYNPITGLSEEIRKHAVPCFELFEDSLTYFTFTLHDGSAEVTMNIDHDTQQMNAMGFSINDDSPAMKLLQAILLGRIDVAPNHVQYPSPIRECVVSSLLAENDHLSDSFREASSIFSRIDSLLKAVKCLESECVCTVDSDPDGSAHLTFTMHQRGELIKVDFQFESLLTDSWSITTVPNDVTVSIVSNDDRKALCSQLQEKARDTLNSASYIDPLLVQRTVNCVMSGLSEMIVK